MKPLSIHAAGTQSKQGLKATADLSAGTGSFTAILFGQIENQQVRLQEANPHPLQVDKVRSAHHRKPSALQDAPGMSGAQTADPSQIGMPSPFTALKPDNHWAPASTGSAATIIIPGASAAALIAKTEPVVTSKLASDSADLVLTKENASPPTINASSFKAIRENALTESSPAFQAATPAPTTTVDTPTSTALPLDDRTSPVAAATVTSTRAASLPIADAASTVTPKLTTDSAEPAYGIETAQIPRVHTLSPKTPPESANLKSPLTHRSATISSTVSPHSPNTIVESGHDTKSVTASMLGGSAPMTTQVNVEPELPQVFHATTLPANSSGTEAPQHEVTSPAVTAIPSAQATTRVSDTPAVASRGSSAVSASPANSSIAPVMPDLKTPNPNRDKQIVDVDSSNTIKPTLAEVPALISGPNPGTLPQSTPLSLHTPVHQSAWADELGQSMTWMMANNKQVAELHLNPGQLGPLDVVISVQGDQATATFSSPHAAVRDAVEQALPKLREMMADNGIALGHTSVNDQSARQQRDNLARKPPAPSASAGRISDNMLSVASQPDNTRAGVSRHTGLLDTFA